ncbi:MAG: hypothetical protein QOF60_1064 [Actinomycetota bacterium]|nr:hypothetical protein [Actinomycetota bacterium]
MLAAQSERGVDVAGALGDVEASAAELAKPAPQRSIVVAALRRAAAAVGSAGALAGSLKAILELLGVR